MIKVLYDNGRTVIDTKEYSDSRRGVVVTFASFGENDVAAEGFGQRFLESNGYAVIAVKKRADNWYRDLGFDEFTSAVSTCFAGHDQRFTYGTSMGAYAALYFSGCLGAEAIAISPRNSVDPRFASQSYAGYVRNWPSAHEPLSNVARSGACPSIVYDPLVSSDKVYIDEEVRPAFPAGHIAPFPFSGHPSAEAMLNIGQLKDFVLKALAGEALPPRIVSAGVKRKSAIILNEMSKWAFGRNRPALAGRLSDAAIEQSSSRADFLYQRGSLLIADGRLDEALALTEKAIAIGGATPSLLHRLATLNLKQGYVEAALEAANSGLGLSARNVGLLRTRRNLLEKKGEIDLAIDDGKALLASVPDSSTDRLKLAGLLILQQAHEEALPHLDIVLALGPDLLAMRRKRNCLDTLGRVDEAIGVAVDIVTTAPENVADIMHLAHLYTADGQIGSALAWLDRAIELAPDNIALFRRKRDYFKQGGQIEQAWRAAMVVHRMAPDSKLDEARLRRLTREHYRRMAENAGLRGIGNVKSVTARATSTLVQAEQAAYMPAFADWFVSLAASDEGGILEASSSFLALLS